MATPAIAEHTWYDATPAQQGIWVLDRIERLRPTYLIPSVVELRGTVDRAMLVASVQRVLSRHPSLRARFRLDARRRRVEYRTDAEPAEVELVEATRANGWSTEERDQLVQELCCTPFDLADGPPARAAVIHVNGHTTLLVLTAHHIVFDGWSRTLLMQEIAQLYRASVLGQEPDLAAPAHPAEVLATPSEHEMAERVAAVVERLRGAPIFVELPFDRHTDDPSPIGATVATELDAELTRRVRLAAAGEGCTPFMAGVALLAGTLARSGRQRDFLFASAWPGRDDPDAVDVVGMFMNVVMLRLRLDDGTTWRELLRRSRTAGVEAFVNGDVPLDAVAAALNPDRTAVWPPLSPVLVNLDEAPREFALAPGVTGRYLPLDPLYVKYDMALFVRVGEAAGPDRLELSIDYPVDLFDRTPVVDFLTALRHSAAALAHGPDDPVLTPRRMEIGR